MTISPVSAVTAVTMTPDTAGTASSTASAERFGQMVDSAISQFQTSQTQAQNVLAQAMAGHGSVTSAMIAVSESQSALDVAAAVRNATVQSVQSLMNLQI